MIRGNHENFYENHGQIMQHLGNNGNLTNNVKKKTWKLWKIKH